MPDILSSEYLVTHLIHQLHEATSAYYHHFVDGAIEAEKMKEFT